MEDDIFSGEDQSKKDNMEDDDGGAGQISNKVSGTLESTIINKSGFLEYNKENIGQFYHVEEVLAMVDIANEGAKSQANGLN